MNRLNHKWYLIQSSTLFAFTAISIAKISITSPIVINVPTRALLAGETKGSFVRLLANLNIKRNLTAVFVNKYHPYQAGAKDSDRQSGSNQLGSPRIMKKKTKLNVIETFTHLKVKIPAKNGPN